MSPKGHTPAAANPAASPASGASLTTKGSPAKVEQLFVPLENLISMSLTVWFSRPNNPIVLSFSIDHVAIVMIKSSIGERTKPTE